MNDKQTRANSGVILVVDDTLINQRLLTTILTKQGFETIGVSDGPAALDAVSTSSPDLILLDIDMPEMSGYEVCERLKKDEQTRDIPVIFISALDSVVDKVKGFSVGGVDYITKPFRMAEVVARIDTHLTLCRLQKQLEAQNSQLRDEITERQRVEKALQEANNLLEQRVENRTAELSRLNKTLQEEIARREKIEKMQAVLKQQLHQTQKMEALGRLAGGVAHDFNNFLMNMVGFSQLAATRPAAQEDVDLRKDLEQIDKGIERAGVLSRRLLAFSRRQVLQLKTQSLNELLEQQSNELEQLLGPDTQLIMRLDPNLKTVKIDTEQIKRVILNLAANARDAMPHGGDFIIETMPVELEAPQFPQYSNFKSGAYIKLALSDTGNGIEPELLPYIFEPFFTTKPKGDGMGLSTVHGIVSQSEGAITVDSNHFQGTRFTIYLPQVERKVDDEADTKMPSESLPAPKTVLVVEDETNIRLLVREYLKERNINVLEASNGNEAMHVCAKHRTPIDLLITDIVMPEINGPDLSKRLMAMHPEMKVLFMSGYVGEAFTNHNLKKSDVVLLEKPFGQNKLLSKMREAMSKK